MGDAVDAAVDVGARFGVATEAPIVLQETNNTVVWLHPHPAVAKVATRPDARVDVALEHQVASELAAIGADIAPPLANATPTTHAPSGHVVTLWERVDGVERADDVAAHELASSLLALHDALAETRTPVPSFRDGIDRARGALESDTFMAPLAANDRAFLRSTYDHALSDLERFDLRPRRLHGEPHGGNRLSTADGLRWIDFESSCVGPVEWDLAFQEDEVVAHFDDIDSELLAVLRRLNSARVATWCWGMARFPDMRAHGEMHLELLRNAAR